MNPRYTKMVLLALCLMFALGYNAYAQETTPEAPIETPVATEEGAIATEVPTTEAPLDVTATDVPTEAPAVTEIAPNTETPIVITPSEETLVLADVFADDFEAFTGVGWTLNGWAMVSDGTISTLSSATPLSTATISAFSQASFGLTASLKVDAGNVATIEANGYKVLFDSVGNNRLYQGDSILATSPLLDPAFIPTEPTWYNVALDFAGNVISLKVNDVLQWTHIADLSFTAGVVVFATGADNTGNVAVDNVSLLKIEDALIIAPTSVATDEPIVIAPETTPEIVTETVVETTPESVADVTPETVVEVAPAVLPFLAIDFESDLTGWQTTGSIISTDDTNHALLLASGSSFAPANALALSDMDITAQVNLLTAESGASLTFGDVLFSLTSTGATLTQNGVNLASAVITLENNVFHTVNLIVKDGVISVCVNGIDTLATPATLGETSVAFTATSNVTIDNISLSTNDVVTSALSLDKLQGVLKDIAQAVANNDTATVEFAVTNYLRTDESGRVLVDVTVKTAEDTALVVSAIEGLGGTVPTQNGLVLSVYIATGQLGALATIEQILLVESPAPATSTGYTQAPNPAPTGTVVTDGFNAIGTLDWHLANVTGTGIKIGVIDSGFGNGTTNAGPAKSGEYACVSTGIVFVPQGKTASVSNHGRNVVEVLCDIAPSASVFLYYADDYKSLAQSLTQARTVDRVNVIAITLDLGADAAPGDGTLGRNDTFDPYAELALARADGIFVFASAGNNGNPADLGVDLANAGDNTVGKAPRYFAFNSGSGATSLNLRVSRGDIVRYSWNDWSGSASFSASMTGAYSTSASGRPSVGGNSIPGNSMTVAAVSGACVTNSVCSVDVSISGPSGYVVQVQVIPVRTATDVLADNSTLGQTADVMVRTVTLGSGATAVANAGSISRPADSPDVIAVGAVCTDDDSNFAPLPDSAVGPIYGTGGSASLVITPPAGTTYARSAIKPDIVGPSAVSTSVSLRNGTNRAFCDGTVSGSDAAGGFGGTSAATAHMAGYAALLRANSVNTSMSIFRVGDAVLGFQAVDNLKNYMQTHSVELPLGANANGYDMQFGAGFATLGLPTFNQSNIQNFNEAPDALACTGSILYVGQANGASTNVGTLANPYTSAGYALKRAVANDCVVLMPGEYMTPIYVNGIANNVRLVSYDDVDVQDTANSIFRVVGQYRKGDVSSDVSFPVGYEVTGVPDNGGIYIENGTNDFTIQGFNFVPARFQAPNEPGFTVSWNRRDVSAIVSRNNDKATITRNTFGDATIDGVSYNGWDNQASNPISVFDGYADIKSNLFNGNTAIATTRVSAITVMFADNALIQDNEFISNSIVITDTFQYKDWKSIIFGEDSAIDVVGNKFVGNSSHVVLKFRTRAIGSGQPDIRMMSNVFLNNTANAQLNQTCGTIIPCAKPGGLINLFQVRDFFFYNNTIVNNDRSAAGTDAIGSESANAIIVRTQGINTFWPDAERVLDFANNLVRDNGTSGFVGGLISYFDDQTIQNTDCRSITGEEPVRHNWWDDAISPSTPCSSSSATAGRGGLTDVNADNEIFETIVNTVFIGEKCLPNITPCQPTFVNTDWRYYGLDGTNPTGRNYAIDKGADITDMDIPLNGANNNFLAPFDLNAINTSRVFDISGLPGAGVDAIDIGAFEFVPLKISDEDFNPALDANAIDDVFALTIPEDNGTVTIDVSNFVNGGFGNLTYAVALAGNQNTAATLTATVLKNYGTQCGAEFDGTKGLVFGTGLNVGKIYYCPPTNFYNQGIAGDNARIEIYYNVIDQANAGEMGKIEITITPVNDQPLSASIGDNNPAGDIIEVTMISGDSISIPLRPSVSFGNFEFSEEENPEFNASGAQIDYPFSFNGLSESGNSSGFTDVVSASISGSNLVITSGALRGTERIRYNACDANSNCSSLNEVRVRVTSTVPSEAGIYDDSSIYWNYINGTPTSNINFWQSIASTSSINNTLHTSNGVGDRAEFSLVGTGYVLYMQAQSFGSNYELVMNTPTGSVINTSEVWTVEPGTTTLSSPRISRKTFRFLDDGTGSGKDADTDEELLTCYARTAFSGIYLSNQGFGPYSVMCMLTDSSPNPMLFNVAVVNNNPNNAQLSVDAFSILNDTTGTVAGPLAPGRYDMDSQELRGVFYTSYPSTLRSGWSEYRLFSLSGGIAFRATGAATASDISFRVAGGTGFAIGTTLEAYGGSFRMCVRDISNSHDICQDVDTSPLATGTFTSSNAFIPFYGLETGKTYEVTLSNIQIPSVFGTSFGNLVIDSIVVFSPAVKPNATLPLSVIENDRLDLFVYEGGVEDSWNHDFSAFYSSNLSLSTSQFLVNQAGPFISFDIPAIADSFVYDYYYTGIQSRRMMVCVDRAVLTATANDFGNCIVVNTRPIGTEPTYQIINATTGAVTNGAEIIQPSNGTLVIKQSMFSTTWAGASKHTVEIFSLLNEQVAFDKVSVYSASQPLNLGSHEDFIPAMNYYKNDTQAVTPGLYNPFVVAQTYTAPVTDSNTFLVHNANYAFSDSGKSVTWTKTVGASVVFGVDGTGFAPRFRLDGNSDGILVCWLKTTSVSLPNPATIKAGGNCQRFDNNFGFGLQADRPILGLESTVGVADYYAVSVTNTGDNLEPSAKLFSPYVNMWFDGVTVYTDNWATLTPISANTKAEANFPARTTNNQFNYFGKGWTNQSFPYLTSYSNTDYDFNNNFGAAIVFRTNGANAIVLRRNLGFSAQRLQVCAAPESNPSNRRCSSLFPSDSPVNNNGYTILLNETNSTVPHIVSLSTMAIGLWNLDAITPVNTNQPLVAGKYDDSNPSIVYTDRAVNLIQNGSMDVDNSVANVYWSSVGTPTKNERGFLWYQPFNSRSIEINADGQGIESRDITFENGKTYVITARVYNDGTGGTISLNLSPSVPGFVAPAPKNFLSLKNWQTFSVTFTATATTVARVQFTSNVTATAGFLRRFFVDDVSVYEQGRSVWETVSYFSALNSIYQRSTTPGAEVRFSFTGTGFSLGMPVDINGGEIEVCYDDNIALTTPDCQVLENELNYTSLTVARTFVGLPLNTYYVRIRDVEDGDSVFATSASVPRFYLYSVGRLSLDYVEVFNNSLPPTITTSVTANEDFKIGGVNALQLLPTSAWKSYSGPFYTTYSDSSYTFIGDPLYGFPTYLNSGPAGVLSVDLTQGATIILVSDAPSTLKSDQLLYCVNGYDGRVQYNFTTRKYELIGATKCKITDQLRTQAQVVLSLPVGTNNSVVTFYTLSPSSFAIDGYQVILGTDLSQGYYESNLSEVSSTIPVGSQTPTLNDEVFEANTPANWSRQSLYLYSGTTSLMLEDTNGSSFTVGNPIYGDASELRFRIKNATGFSLMTHTNPNGGKFRVIIDGAGANDFTIVADTYAAFFNYNVSIPFTGLPQGDYTVRIRNGETDSTNGAKNLLIDAIEVYGTLQNLGSLYDNNQKTVAGIPLITYGPSNKSWTLTEGSAAFAALNATLHSTTINGAVAMFEVGGNGLNNATGITLIYTAGLSNTTIQVCYKDLNVPTASPVCSANLNLALNATGRQFVSFGAAGRYAVTIINRAALRVQLDAIQVQETGGLTEGIYTVAELNANNGVSATTSFVGGATNWTIPTFVNATAVSRVNNAQLQFQMKGIGFSILLSESFSTATSYSICVDKVAGGVTCDTIGNAGSPLTLNRIASPGGIFALTYMGLHSATGDDETYTVTLTHTDPSVFNVLQITGVHIMSAKNSTDMKLTTNTAKAENNDARVRYLPFGWAVDTIDRSGNVSGNSQHIGIRRGGIIYFEFQSLINSFEYVRQVSFSFSDAEVCFGRIGVTPPATANQSANCLPVDNNSTFAFGRANVISTALTCDVAPGCWAYIRDLQDFSQMATDFVRLINPNDPLQAGYYEESFVGLRNFNSALTLSSSATDTLGMNITTPVLSLYSGSAIRRYTAAPTTAPVTTSALNGGMYFTMTGTGFGVYFTLDPYQDEVRICYKDFVGAEPSVNTVLTTGRCQNFDNQDVFTYYKSRRTILGLPQATYAVVVQMLPDNNQPATHIAFYTPIRMDIDAVEVYNDIWFDNNQTNWNNNTRLNALTPSQGRIETNFATRLTDKNFLYLGNWSYASNQFFTTYSGTNYDIVSQAGASILFRTAGANAISLIAPLSAFYSNVYICATPVNASNPLVESGARNCSEVSLAGTGTQQALTFKLGSSVDEYVVSISTKNSNQFYLDAIELYDTTAPMTAGTYEATDPRLSFDATYTNYVPNGNMELLTNWSGVNAPDFNLRFGGGIEGLYQRYVYGALNKGIISDTFTLPSTQIYTVAARVNVYTGSVQMRIKQGATPILTYNIGTPLFSWQTIRQDISLAPGNYTVEFIGSATLNAFYLDNVQVSTGGTWKPEYLYLYSNGSMYRSNTTGASMNFNFTGTGFEIGTILDPNGGEVEICYGVGTPTNCFVYQHETYATSYTSSRVVAGLPFNTYTVRVRDVEDGKTTTVLGNANAFRPSFYNVAKIGIDYVRIFGANTTTAVNPGFYNENATDGSGISLVRYFPANRFRNFTSPFLTTYSEKSYTSIIDTFNNVAFTYAGPTAMMSINKTAGKVGTLILYTGNANFFNTDQMLVCGNNTTGSVRWNGSRWDLTTSGTVADCVLKTGLKTENQIVLTGSELNVLSTNASGIMRLTFTPLTPGRFDIDGFQYVLGDGLSAGIHDEFLAPSITTNSSVQGTSLLKFAAGNNFGLNYNTTLFSSFNPTGCNRTTQWCLLKTSAAYGNGVAYTTANNATLTFNIEGTGFSIVTLLDLYGMDMRICYKRTSNPTDFPAPNLPDNTVPVVKKDVVLTQNDKNGIWCDMRRTSSSSFNSGAIQAWQNMNGDLYNPGFGGKYGFSYYGLPFGKYTVEVKVIDSIITSTFTDRLAIDSIVVFGNGNNSPVLTPGLYDDTTKSTTYEPAPFWETSAVSFYAPPFGPYGYTERTTTSAGAVAQMRVAGNSIVIYQSLNGLGSRDVQVCLVVTSANIHCNVVAERPVSYVGGDNDKPNAAWSRAVQLAQYSQVGFAKFSPVMFYGLGTGTHQLIIENRDHNRIMSIDAILVQP
jgi:hypothetical protein